MRRPTGAPGRLVVSPAAAMSSCNPWYRSTRILFWLFRIQTRWFWSMVAAASTRYCWNRRWARNRVLNSVRRGKSRYTGVIMPHRQAEVLTGTMGLQQLEVRMPSKVAMGEEKHVMELQVARVACRDPLQGEQRGQRHGVSIGRGPVGCSRV
jgi:hypothetical protein